MTGADKDPLDIVFMALANQSRRNIVHRLADKELTINELKEGLDMSLAAVSKHIKVLEKAKLVRRRIEGRVHNIALAPEKLTGALDWISIYRNFWQQRMNSLAEIIENNEE